MKIEVTVVAAQDILMLLVLDQLFQQLDVPFDGELVLMLPEGAPEPELQSEWEIKHENNS